ncbi:phosphoserine aminotransferase 2, chloroplastic-like [Dendrobium catenatum]|uniref:Phosphoserine aminotransferase n=1 Tax=Dendrobium catenatum TaxID=906689 RepID=A0A2I0VDH7_9ASPA|nr:phosphoserine aminotransferase 2, chloroplastic-like [Dendrobium catenatum]PKU61467.1 Phosphoserine aminotransferase, chloroplastic [Dendrobium catenatum]
MATATLSSTSLTYLHFNSSSFWRRRFSISCAAVLDRGIYNFAAGPATLPESVLLKAQSELYNYRGSGMSIMEISHRGKEFDAVIKKAESDLRSLLSISDDFAVLFLQGGATTQFSAVPLNLCMPEDSADYIVTGSWSVRASKEAQKFCKPNVIWSGKSEKYTRICSFDEIPQTLDAKYLHICGNETVQGVEFKDYPNPMNKSSILVADMSSNFCSKPVDISKFGVIYAGAQKNVGPSGVTIVIIRRALLGHAQPIAPVMLDYKAHADTDSLYNTPPCFTIYICSLVFEYLLHQGGLVAMEKKNEKKAGVLYDAIDASGEFYVSHVEKSVRSLMNVPFTLQRSELEKKFIEEAAKEGMVQLKGHLSVGGVRASIYNAMPLAGVEKLVAFMKDFQARHP